MAVKQTKELENFEANTITNYKLCGILTGCGGNKVTISEINLENVNDNVKSFIENVEYDEKGTGTGIYIYNGSKTRKYLNRVFLDDGRSFGDIDIKTD